jgi:hypothetical protein
MRAVLEDVHVNCDDYVEYLSRVACNFMTVHARGGSEFSLHRSCLLLT